MFPFLKHKECILLTELFDSKGNKLAPGTLVYNGVNKIEGKQVVTQFVDKITNVYICNCRLFIKCLASVWGMKKVKKKILRDVYSLPQKKYKSQKIKIKK